MAYIDQFGVPEDVNNALGMSPPFIQSRDEAVSKLAQQRATKWRKALASFGTGLSASLSQPSGGAAFVAGLGGGLQGGEQFAAQEDERQFIRNRQAMADQMAQREADQRAIGIDQTQQRIDLDKQQMAEVSRHNLAVEGKPGAVGSEYNNKPWWLDPSVDPKLAAQARDNALADPGGIDVSMLDEPTREMMARVYMNTGIPPSFRGKGASQAQLEIYRTAAHIDPNADVAGNAADYKTNVASLSKVKQLYDNSSAFEKTAVRNSKILMDAIDKIPDYGNQPSNSLMRTIKSKAGDPAMSAFNTARKVAFTEWARLVGSPGAAGGVITDTQLKELDDLLASGATKEQMKAAVNTFVQDGINKRISYSEQMDDLRNRIRYNPAKRGTNPNPNSNVVGGDASTGVTGEAPANPLDRFVK